MIYVVLILALCVVAYCGPAYVIESNKNGRAALAAADTHTEAHHG